MFALTSPYSSHNLACQPGCKFGTMLRVPDTSLSLSQWQNLKPPVITANNTVTGCFTAAYSTCMKLTAEIPSIFWWWDLVWFVGESINYLPSSCKGLGNDGALFPCMILTLHNEWSLPVNETRWCNNARIARRPTFFLKNFSEWTKN